MAKRGVIARIYDYNDFIKYNQFLLINFNKNYYLYNIVLYHNVNIRFLFAN